MKHVVTIIGCLVALSAAALGGDGTKEGTIKCFSGELKDSVPMDDYAGGYWVNWRNTDAFLVRAPALNKLLEGVGELDELQRDGLEVAIHRGQGIYSPPWGNKLNSEFEAEPCNLLITYEPTHGEPNIKKIEFWIDDEIDLSAVVVPLIVDVADPSLVTAYENLEVQAEVLAIRSFVREHREAQKAAEEGLQHE